MIEALSDLMHGWLALFLIATAIGILFVAIGKVPRLYERLTRRGKSADQELFYGRLPDGHPLLRAIQGRGFEDDGKRLRVINADVEMATIRVVGESTDGQMHVVRFRLSEPIKASLRTGVWPTESELVLEPVPLDYRPGG